MKKVFAFLTIVLQSGFTFALLVGIFMLFALLESDFGFDGLVGLIFSFIYAVLFSLFTIFICLFVGLPLRLNDFLKSWWRRNDLISPIGIAIGILLLIIATLPNVATVRTDLVYGQNKTSPNATIALAGWFLTAFMSLHFFTPRIITEKFVKKFRTKKNVP